MSQRTLVSLSPCVIRSLRPHLVSCLSCLVLYVLSCRSTCSFVSVPCTLCSLVLQKSRASCLLRVLLLHVSRALCALLRHVPYPLRVLVPLALPSCVSFATNCRFFRAPRAAFTLIVSCQIFCHASHVLNLPYFASLMFFIFTYLSFFSMDYS